MKRVPHLRTHPSPDPAPSLLPLPNLQRHLPSLDALRGFAVLGVMAYHFTSFSDIPATDTVGKVWRHLASTGWSGVDLFFVLSGFLITGILTDAREKPGFFRTFYTRRALRILPLYYVVLVLFFLVLPAVGSLEVVDANASVQSWYWGHAVNIQVALHGWGATSQYLDHFWSLAVEEQFYLVWPLVVFLLSRRALLRCCGMLIVVSLLLRILLHAAGESAGAYVLMPARMDALAMGAVLALIMRDPAHYQVLRRWLFPGSVLVATALVGIVAWRGGLDNHDPVTGTIGFTLLAALFAAALAAALGPPSSLAVRGLTSAGPLRFFGKHSYALYAFHQPISLFLTAAGLSSVFRGAGAPSWAALLSYNVAATLVSLAAALLSWHLYEKHFLKLKERFGFDAPPVSSGSAGRGVTTWPTPAGASIVLAPIPDLGEGRPAR